MLSPNATNRVAPIRGGAVTITANEQASVRLSASVALQTTLVDPIGNVDGLVGLHLIATGAAPPITAGAGYVTLTACPSRDACVWDAGQVIFGASGVGVGFVDDPAQAAAHSPATNAPLRKRIIATLKPILEASVDHIADMLGRRRRGPHGADSAPWGG
jgi:hypothetical protein